MLKVCLVVFIALIALIVWVRLNIPHAVIGSVNDVYNSRLNTGVFPYYSYHIAPRFHNESIEFQYERIASVKRTTRAALRALSSIGLTIFLDSGTLIGFVRHDGDMVPWDDDNDFGFFKHECESLGWSPQAAIAKALECTDFVIDWFDCHPRLKKDGYQDVSGRIVDTETGFFIDLFSFEGPKRKCTSGTSSSSKSEPRTSTNESADCHEVFERLYNSIPFYPLVSDTLPLKKIDYLGVPAFIPANPREYLAPEFGRILTESLYPWSWQLNIRFSLITIFLVILMIGLSAKSAWDNLSNKHTSVALLWIGYIISMMSAWVLIKAGFRWIFWVIATSIMLSVVFSRRRSSVFSNPYILLGRVESYIDRRSKPSSPALQSYSAFRYVESNKVSRLTMLLLSVLILSLLWDAQIILYQVYEHILELFGYAYYRTHQPRHVKLCIAGYCLVYSN